jgi:hypothetical protein
MIPSTFCDNCGARLSPPKKIFCTRRCQRKSETAKLRAEFIEEYGGRCECCGESEPDFLSLDHIYSDGAAHRKQLRRGNIYRDLKRLGWPKDRYRLLCFDCNLGRSRHGGRCPHENNDAVNAEMDLSLDLSKNELREALPA